MSASVLPISDRHVSGRADDDPILMRFLEDQPNTSCPADVRSAYSTYMGSTSTGGKDDGADYESDD